MASEYSFKLETCSCGADLSGLKAEATSYRDGRFPQAKCPNCGNDLLLEAPLAWPKPPAKGKGKTTTQDKPESEPEPEPETEPESK